MADDQQSPPPENGTAPRGLVARAVAFVGALAAGALRIVRFLTPWILRYRRMLILAACGLFVLASGMLTMRLVQKQRDRVLAEGLTVEAALEKLDAGDYTEARRMARLLPAAHGLNFDQMGEAHFLLGAAIAYETDAAWDEPNRARFYALAARHLQQARERQFPAGRESEGRLLLGRCLIETGRYAQSIAPLLEIKEASPALKAETQRLLAIAYLRSSPADLDKAARCCDAFLTASRQTPTERRRAKLLKSEILLRRGDLDACEKVLRQLEDASEADSQRLLMLGRLRMARAEKIQAESAAGDAQPPAETPSADELYAQAIELFRQAQGRHSTGDRVASQSAYWIGLALRRRGELRAAQEQFFRTRKRFFNTPEGVMASLEEAEVQLELGELEQSLRAYRRAAEHVGSAEQFSSPYLTSSELKERVEHGFEQFLAANRFDLATALSRSLTRLLGTSDGLRLRAQAYHRWGDYLASHAVLRSEDQAAQQGDAAGDQPLDKQSRQKYRDAAMAYARLARDNYTTREYPRYLWMSGRDFNLGRDYHSAVVMLSEYLQTEAQTERPLVLIALGEAYLSLNELDSAIVAIEDCLRDFHKDPAAYQARLLASTAYVEKGDFARARELLETNLHHESLAPRSDVWRDSLFALGMILYDEARMVHLEQAAAQQEQAAAGRSLADLERGHALARDAIRQLSEAVARYPRASQVLPARYAIAASFRLASRLPLAKLENESIENRRATLNREVEEDLTEALAEYDRLIAQVNAAGHTASHTAGPLTAQQEKILRNAYFARGSILYDLGSYEEAIKAYSTATSRYQYDPAALEAYVQIAACYRRMNKPLDARGTLEQAKLVMERIPPDADFLTTTRFGREEWDQLLNWLSTL